MTKRDEYSTLQFDMQDVHLEYLEITRQWLDMSLPYFYFAMIGAFIGLFLYFLQVDMKIIGCFFVALYTYLQVAIRVGVRTLHDSRLAINKRVDQWVENQEALREIALQKAQSDNITIKGGQQVINQENSQAQVLMMQENVDVKTFLKHRREFLERAKSRRLDDVNKTGLERDYWLHATVEGGAYQWSDGLRISRPEYEGMIETLDGTELEPVGRRKGSKGQVKTPTLLPQNE